MRNPFTVTSFVCLALTVVLGLTACGPIGRPESTAAVEPQTNPTPTFTVEVVQETATQSVGPICTALQDLSLRSGPGTAYRPPLKVLPANMEVIPLGFNEPGIPEGSWVFVQDPSSLEKGWVSAGSQFLSCTLDLATLPSVPVGTPPPPALPKSALTSTPEGNCGTPYECDVILTDEALVEFRVMQDGKALTEQDGVEQVKFTVRTLDGDTEIYTNTETASGYCIFGGPVSCDPWFYQDDVYRWGPDGEIAQSGEYNLTIEASVNGEFLFWTADFKLILP
jgi:hypothetical protein